MANLTRRQFNKLLGAGVLIAPFLRGEAQAQSVTKRARRVIFFCTQAPVPKFWRPLNLQGESKFTFNVMTQPLAAIQDSVVLVDGLSTASPGDGHGSKAALTGCDFSVNPVVSVDQYIATRLQSSSPVPSLLLGALTSSFGNYSWFYNNGSPVSTIASPQDAFSAAFGSATSTLAATPSGPTPAQLLQRRQSILDLALKQITALNQTLGQEQRARLALHADSIRQLETRLAQQVTPPNGGGGGSCAASAPAAVDPTNFMLLADQSHLDIIINAMACGITQVAAIQFGGDQSTPVNLPSVPLAGEGHGEFTHGGSGDNWSKLILLEQWFAQRFVDLVTKLKARPEADGSGTMLDNTLVVWAREMGNPVVHNQYSMAYVLAGGAGGYLKTAPTGRYLNFGGDGGDGPNGANVTGQRHERLLLNICEAMGVTDYSGFGILKAGEKVVLPNISTL